LLQRLGMVRVGVTAGGWPVYAITREVFSAEGKR
jgi:hypothetical protein